jgi:hypothetical protein
MEPGAHIVEQGGDGSEDPTQLIKKSLFDDLITQIVG